MLEFVRGLRARVKERRRLKKFARAQAWSDGLGLQATFEKIYHDGMWGKPDGVTFWSGNGSKPEFSAVYENFVVEFLERHTEIASMVDIGCGDFQVASRILSRLDRPVRYTGCDIVRPMIDHHQKTFGNDTIDFRVVNAVEEDPPQADLVFIRQVLQHLSNDQAQKILDRAKRLFKIGIVTESLPVPAKAANLDIKHGIATRIALGSGIYVNQPPFNLVVTDSFDVPHSVNETIRTSVVRFD